MTLIESIILGLIQGLTEFLPISSSGHLILVPAFLGWEEQGLVFDTVMHLGTASALIFYFYKDLLEMLKKTKSLILLLVGSIPAGLVGFLFDDFIENVFRHPLWVAVFLILGSVLMLMSEFINKKAQNRENLEEITVREALLIGLFQTLALLPGFSRSGSTISGGMILGLPRESAARYSFLLSIPIVVAAAFYQLIKSYSQGLSILNVNLIAGYFASFIVGYVAIDFLIRFLKTHTLKSFVIYRIILSIVVIGAIFFKII